MNAEIEFLLRDALARRGIRAEKDAGQAQGKRAPRKIERRVLAQNAHQESAHRLYFLPDDRVRHRVGVHSTA